MRPSASAQLMPRAKLEQYAERRLLTADTDALGLLPSAEPETPAE